MTITEEYREHIEYTFNAYCKIVIRHAAIDAARQRYSRCKREISLEYLTDELHYPLSTQDKLFQTEEPTEEYPLTLCGQTVVFTNGQLAAALLRLPERKQEMIYLYFFQRHTQKEIGRRYGHSRSTAGYHIRRTLRQLHEEMEVLAYEQQAFAL